MIPMLDLKLEYEHQKAVIDQAIAKCLEHQQWILGPEVREFEADCAAYLGAPHCIGLSSGTDALVLSLRALAIRRKGTETFDKSDLILTTPFSFAASADAILRARATPVFIDIDPRTLTIDAAKIKESLSGLAPAVRKKVAGIVPVHLFGLAAAVNEIRAIAAENGLFVVEDAAQAFGRLVGGKKAGTLGDAGIFSFFPTKNLGGFGDAGMACTRDAETAAIIRMLSKHGGKDKFNIEHLGYNARLDTLQAAVLKAKLPFVDRMNQKRYAIARAYTEALIDLADVITPFNDSDRTYNQYTLRVTGGKRGVLARHLKERGIDTQIFYPLPLHHMKLFMAEAINGTKLFESDLASQEVLSLPIEPWMAPESVAHVAGAIREFFGQPKKPAKKNHAHLDPAARS